jgi:ABC-type transport system involved in multi-copper enzyme maturation permease subunit
VGPLFYYELVRLARRGRSTLLRCAYASALLVALYFAYRERFPSRDPLTAPFTSAPTVPGGQLAYLASGFVLAILRVQTVGLFVLVPAYVGGAIAEEKERRTLELLFATQLRDREIVLGKLAARLTQLGGVLLAGLPLLALTQLWGGVDMRLLVAAFGVTAVQLVSVGTLSVFCSVYARTTWGALALSYAVSAAVFGCSLAVPGATPTGLFTLMTAIGDRPWTAGEFGVVAGCVLGHAALTLAFGTLAVYSLRSAALSRVADAHALRPVSRAWEAEDYAADDPPVPSSPRLDPPEVRDRPLLWKEIYRSGASEHTREFEFGLRKDWPAILLMLVFIPALLWAITLTASNYRAWLGIRDWWVRVALVCSAGTWCVGTAFRGAGSVSLERDQRTLDGLLTLPSDRAAVLGAKWLGSVARGRLAGYWLGLVGAIAFLSGTLHAAAVPLLAAAVAVQLCFWASLGLWLSVACRSTLQARVLTATLLLLILGGSLAYRPGDAPFYRYGFGTAYGSAARAALPTAVSEVGVNPVRAWWFLAFGWTEFDDRAPPWLFPVRLTVAAGGVVLFAICSGALWLDAWRRFRKA